MFSLALRAALLDGSVFDEIRDRPESMFSALGIVLIAGVAFGLGVWQVLQDPARQGFDYDQNLSLVVAVSSVFTGWFVWSVFAWLLAGRLFWGERRLQSNRACHRYLLRSHDPVDSDRGPGDLLDRAEPGEVMGAGHGDCVHQANTRPVMVEGGDLHGCRVDLGGCVHTYYVRVPVHAGSLRII